MTTKRTILEELNAAIRTASREAEPATPSREIAAVFCESQADLIQPFLPEWAIEKVASLIRKYRGQARSHSDEQLRFEGILGLTHIPKAVRLKSGNRIPKMDATRGQLRQALSQARNDAAVKDLKAAVELMGKYTRKEQKITWGEVLRREAEKAAHVKR